jgi:hypothetical protein
MQRDCDKLDRLFCVFKLHRSTSHEEDLVILKPIALATLISGTLDIVFAITLTILFGRQVDAMLRYVASGPFPAASNMGLSGAALGLAVHFALMAAMAAMFMWLVKLRPQILRTPYLAGVGYGVLTYFLMNWAVVPLRFGVPLPPTLLSIATQLFAHILLVGVPFALIAARWGRPHVRT